MVNPAETRHDVKFEELSPEVQEKAKACTTPEELLTLAKEEGIELTDTELESISGGWGGCSEYHRHGR